MSSLEPPKFFPVIVCGCTILKMKNTNGLMKTLQPSSLKKKKHCNLILEKLVFHDNRVDILEDITQYIRDILDHQI